MTQDEEEFVNSLEGPTIEKNNTLLSRERDAKIIIIWFCVFISSWKMVEGKKV